MSLERIPDIPRPRGITDVKECVSYLNGLATTLQDHMSMRPEDLQHLIDGLSTVNIYDVKHYGAIGDGVADDTVNVQKAVTAAGTDGVVFFPPGTYIISNLTAVSDLKLIGINKESCILKHKAASSDYMIEGAGVLELTDLTFDGNKDNQTAISAGNAGVELVSFDGSKISVRNCIFQNSHHSALYVLECTQAEIVGNDFLEPEEGAAVTARNTTVIAVYPSVATQHVKILHNNFSQSAPSDTDQAACAILIQGTNAKQARCQISDNTFDGFGRAYTSGALGVIDFYNDSDESIITNNRFVNSYYSPLKLSDSANLIVTGNIIKDPATTHGGLAIVVYSYNHTTVIRNTAIIADNIIENSTGGSAIYITGVSGHLTSGYNIHHNTILDGYRGVVVIYATGPIIIDSNIIDGTNFDSALPAIQLGYCTGRVSVTNNNVHDFPKYGVYAESTSSDMKIIVKGNTFKYENTITTAVFLNDVATVLCEGNEFIGDAVPINIDNVTDARIDNNLSENSSVSFTNITTLHERHNSWNKPTDRTSDVATSTVTVANTTDETTLWTGEMAANSLEAGDVFMLHADGVVSNGGPTAPDQIKIRIRVGGTEIVSLEPITKSLSDDHWHIDANACQRTIGGSGSRAVHVDLGIGDDSVNLTGVASIDTTANMDVTITAEWASADVANTISLYQGFMRYKN